MFALWFWAVILKINKTFMLKFNHSLSVWHLVFKLFNLNKVEFRCSGISELRMYTGLKVWLTWWNKQQWIVFVQTITIIVVCVLNQPSEFMSWICSVILNQINLFAFQLTDSLFNLPDHLFRTTWLISISSTEERHYRLVSWPRLVCSLSVPVVLC